MPTSLVQVPDGPGLEVFVLGSGEPSVTVLGGVHGDELEGVFGTRALADSLSASPLRGTVRIVPRTNPPALERGTRLGPDGGNLARSFPGDPTGSLTERIAHTVGRELIRPADLLVDVHSAGRGYRMPELVGIGGGTAFRRRSMLELARATVMPYVWVHGSVAPGRSVSLAHELGIPWLYLESGGGGAVRRAHLDRYVDTVRRILVDIGVLDGTGEPIRGDDQVIVTDGDGNTDEGVLIGRAGLFVGHVSAGDPVRDGQVLGIVHDATGAPLEQVRAESDGWVMMLRHEMRVCPGDIAAVVAGEAR